MASSPLGGYYPGTLATGIKPPQVPYKGDTWNVTKLTGRLVTVPSGGGTTTFTIRKNGSSIGTVTLTSTNQATTTIGSTEIVDGDYFDIQITNVQATEGADLAWNIAP